MISLLLAQIILGLCFLKPITGKGEKEYHDQFGWII